MKTQESHNVYYDIIIYKKKYFSHSMTKKKQYIHRFDIYTNVYKMNQK